MAWTDTLYECEFRGIEMTVLKVEDHITRDIAEHEIPYRDGAYTEDKGEKARGYSVTAIVWGANYEAQRDALLNAISQPGPGLLVHPIYGAVQVQLLSATLGHVAGQRDACSLHLVFKAALPVEREALFAQRAPTAAADAAAETAQVIDEITLDALAEVDIDLADPQASADWAEALADLQAFASTVASTVQTGLAIGTDLLKLGRAIQAAYARIAPAWQATSAGSASQGTAKRAAWVAASSKTNQARGRSQPRPALCETLEMLAATTRLASLAADLLADDARYADLSPAEIEQISADARALIHATLIHLTPPRLTASGHPAHQALHARIVQVSGMSSPSAQLLAADLLRCNPALNTATTPTERQLRAMAGSVAPQLASRLAQQAAPPFSVTTTRRLTEPLRSLAHHLQQAAQAAINQRPPLITRPAPLNGNLALIAHHWYGDASRAAELARLNPQIRLPNFIQRGQVLTAYAR